MCIQTILKIQKVIGNRAQMEDGREVMLGDIRHVLPGQYLEVYANIAIEKAEKPAKGARL
jgi:hypothetical protein